MEGLEPFAPATTRIAWFYEFSCFLRSVANPRHCHSVPALSHVTRATVKSRGCFLRLCLPSRRTGTTTPDEANTLTFTGNLCRSLRFWRLKPAKTYSRAIVSFAPRKASPPGIFVPPVFALKRHRHNQANCRHAKLVVSPQASGCKTPGTIHRKQKSHIILFLVYFSISPPSLFRFPGLSVYRSGFPFPLLLSFPLLSFPFFSFLFLPPLKPLRFTSPPLFSSRSTFPLSLVHHKYTLLSNATKPY